VVVGLGTVSRAPGACTLRFAVRSSVEEAAVACKRLRIIVTVRMVGGSSLMRAVSRCPPISLSIIVFVGAPSRLRHEGRVMITHQLGVGAEAEAEVRAHPNPSPSTPVLVKERGVVLKRQDVETSGHLLCRRALHQLALTLQNTRTVDEDRTRARGRKSTHQLGQDRVARQLPQREVLRGRGAHARAPTVECACKSRWLHHGVEESGCEGRRMMGDGCGGGGERLLRRGRLERARLRSDFRSGALRRG
jgi:hypothetical protein